MLHPLFSTIVQRPDLVIDHISAYGSLFQKEATSAGSELLIRAAAGLVSLVAFVVFFRIGWDCINDRLGTKPVSLDIDCGADSFVSGHNCYWIDCDKAIQN